jgi:hypothetical protein
MLGTRNASRVDGHEPLLRYASNIGIGKIEGLEGRKPAGSSGRSADQYSSGWFSAVNHMGGVSELNVCGIWNSYTYKSSGAGKQIQIKETHFISQPVWLLF